MTQVAET